MIRSLVTQMLEVLERVNVLDDDCDIFFEPLANAVTESITAAREYLATEPSGERAELIERQRWVQENGANPAMRALAKSTADMLEADAQQAKRVPQDEPEEEDLYALALKADNWGQP